ncbi:MAG: hypothetical protein ACLQVI_27640 [Polyangiaceae bacterium]|jgi:hypothetical protein
MIWGRGGGALAVHGDVPFAASGTEPEEQTGIVSFSLPREKVPTAWGVRSTLIASSIRCLRDHGLYDDYVARVDPGWRETLLEAVAGVWLPIDAGLAHYGACEALGLSSAEQVEIGREVGDRIQGTFLASMVRAAKGAGMTPWNALPFTGKLYERLFEGGGVRVVKVGPKEARCAVTANPLVGLGYFRNGFRGLYQVAIELFCAKAYVTDVPKSSSGMACEFKIAWA